jgi:hypothetical protein
LIDRTLGTIEGRTANIVIALGNAWNGSTSLFHTSCNYWSAGADCWNGKDFSGETISAYKIYRAVVYGSNSRGFGFLESGDCTLELRGKNGTPSSATDGTLLGSTTFTDTANESAGREILSSDKLSSWSNVWVNGGFSGGATNFYYAEIQLYGS